MDATMLSKRCGLRVDAGELTPSLRQRPRPLLLLLTLQAQVTKQGTVIQQVGEHDIRDTGKGLHVEANVGDDVLVELIARAAERYEGSLTAYGPADFQLRIARVAGVNHLAVSFADRELGESAAGSPGYGPGAGQQRSA